MLINHHPLRRLVPIAMATAATAATMLVLDLTWLGVVARGLYDSSLAPLKREAVFLPAAGLFYVLYIGVIMTVAVLSAARPSAAARRGAGSRRVRNLRADELGGSTRLAGAPRSD